MPRVLVVGSANVDVTVAVARLPEPGETVTNGTLLVSRGGKGANQAVAARRLGADVRLIGCVGADASGAEIRTALAAEGIDTAAVMTTAAAATGTALIIVDRDGGNQIAVAPGANRALTVAHVEERAADFAWAEVVVASCEVPLPVVRAALALARRGRVTTILNPAPVPDTRLDFLDLVDYLTPNAGEAARLSGVPARDDPDGARAVEALRGRGAGCVIITVGARGAIVCRDRERVVVPAPRVQAVDTTGAGDAFNGALAVALAERRPLADALRFSNAAAALACTRRGAQPALPSRGEVERLLA